jgi:iron complex transport system substrate-binding protein
MREQWRRLLLLVWALLTVLPALAVTITDDRGVTVVIERTPQRIVTLLPSLAETVCELGQCARLVGVDRYANFPQSVQRLPKVGGGLDPNIEAVVALKPDLVLIATSSRAAARLEALGLKVVALEPKTHADVRRVLETVAKILGVPEAQRVWRDIDAAVASAARSMPQGGRPVQVYFEVSSAPHGASEASFIGETLARLGAKNIVPASMGPFPKLNPEFVVRANPDLIMGGTRNVAGMALRPGWGNIRAMREQRICAFTEDQADVLMRAGPRMAEGARLMARCIAEKSM